MSFTVSQLEIKTWLDVFYLDSSNYNWFIPTYNTKEAPTILYKFVNLIYSKLLFWVYDSIVSYFLVSLPNFLGL